MKRHERCAVVPPFLLERVAAAKGLSSARAAAEKTLVAQDPGRRASIDSSGRRRPSSSQTGSGSLTREIYDAGGTEELPGSLVRSERDSAIDDAAANEAYDGLGQTYALFDDVYERSSIDGQGMPLVASVHFGTDYDNAFWNGSQMVFGDGDGEVFNRLTISLSVIGHELTHGVTEHTAALRYHGQSGALSESVSDVFGCLVEQYAADQTAAEASWLVGEGLFTDRVQGIALRSLKAPGTAYDDDVLGKDPQPATMAGYVDTTEDEGGVHINSGIPNHAFYLVAAELGGHAWEHAGSVWYKALTGGALGTDATFADFARITVSTAENNFDSDVAHAVRGAWQSVGVTDDSAREQDGTASGTSRTIVVERSGGVTGISRSWSVDITQVTDAESWRRLIGSLTWGAVESASTAGADRYRYRIRCPAEDGSGGVLEAFLPEEGMTQDWRELIRLVRENAEK